MKRQKLTGLLLACLLVLGGCVPSSAPPDHAPSPPAASSSVPSSLAPESKISLSETWGEAGSAKTLTGSTLVVNLFLSDAESQWDSQSRTDAMEMLEEAFAFLTEEAARYGQEIRLTQTDKLASYYLTFDQAVEDNLEYYQWTDQMLPQNGFADFAALLEDAVKQAGEAYDNVAAIVHLNKPGRSYALPFHRGNEEKYQAEHLVMFFNEDASILITSARRPMPTSFCICSAPKTFTTRTARTPPSRSLPRAYVKTISCSPSPQTCTVAGWRTLPPIRWGGLPNCRKSLRPLPRY